MSFGILTLYYFCSFAGLTMIVGGMWLLYTQKIYIDRESQQITEVETPIGKFKTNVPALALFGLGFIPLIYPIWKSAAVTEVARVRILGNVHASIHPVLIHAVIQSEAVQQDRAFSLSVPVLNETQDEYKIVYIAGNVVVEDLVDLRQAEAGQIRLRDKEITSAPAAAFEPAIRVHDVPPEFQ